MKECENCQKDKELEKILYEYKEDKDNLIQILNEKFYSTTELEELTKINQLYQLLGHKTESWLSAIQPKDSKQKN